MWGLAIFLLTLTGYINNLFLLSNYIKNNLSVIILTTITFTIISIIVIIYKIKKYIKGQKSKNKETIDLHCYENMPNEANLET